MVLSAMPWCSLLLPGLLVFGQADKTPASPTRNALALWQEGQEAMKRGEIPKALTLYQESRKLDPGLARVELSLAAAQLQSGLRTARWRLLLPMQPEAHVWCGWIEPVCALSTTLHWPQLNSAYLLLG